MKFLLDTNICVFLIRNKGMRVHEHIRGHRVGEIGISAITECELFFLTLPVLAFDSGCTREYGRIRAFLEKKGTPIGSLDMLIAAHALGMGLTLVTNNTREFSRVPRLRFEDWTKG